jgi:hypothetical protein
MNVVVVAHQKDEHTHIYILRNNDNSQLDELTNILADNVVNPDLHFDVEDAVKICEGLAKQGINYENS